jgi:hypothetical protein
MIDTTGNAGKVLWMGEGTMMTGMILPYLELFKKNYKKFVTDKQLTEQLTEQRLKPRREAMFQRTRVHNGLMAQCLTCTPDYKKKRDRRDFDKPKREKATTVEGVLRRQMAEEIGEDELSKDFRFGLMQKYGIIAPRIDRRVTKPNWMEEATWKKLKQEFHNATKGLVPERSTFRPVKPVAERPIQRPIQKTGERYRGNKALDRQRRPRQ